MSSVLVPDDKQADVLVALVSRARPVGMGVFNHRPNFTRADAVGLIESLREASGRVYFDYVNGCPIKVFFADGAIHRLDLFDRDNGGPGTGERIVQAVLDDYPRRDSDGAL